MCNPCGKGDHNLWLGLIMFVIGAVVLLQKFDIVPDTTWGWLWPAILVVLGLKFMLVCCSCGDSCGTGCCDGGVCDEKPMKKKVMKKKKLGKKKKK
jgi:hypothetical protein